MPVTPNKLFPQMRAEVEGKTVALVGASHDLLLGRYAKEIDSADEVVRVNAHWPKLHPKSYDMALTGYKGGSGSQVKYLGERTDIMFCTQPQISPAVLKRFERSQLRVIFANSSETLGCVNHTKNADAWARERGSKIYYCKNQREFGTKLLGEPVLINTGILAAYCLLQAGVFKLRMYGFNFYSHRPRPKRSHNGKGHDQILIRKFADKLIFFDARVEHVI